MCVKSLEKGGVTVWKARAALGSRGALAGSPPCRMTSAPSFRPRSALPRRPLAKSSPGPPTSAEAWAWGRVGSVPGRQPQLTRCWGHRVRGPASQGCMWLSEGGRDRDAGTGARQCQLGRKRQQVGGRGAACWGQGGLLSAGQAPASRSALGLQDGSWERSLPSGEGPATGAGRRLTG